jgi:hypothetical protein
MTAGGDKDSSLAAIISTIADGQTVTALDRDILKLKLVDQAQENGVSWDIIARVLRYPSGRQAKRDIHRLRAKVRREQLTQELTLDARRA